MRRGGGRHFVERIDWDAVIAWALGFGLVLYVAFKGGGFDPLVHDQVGIAVWWIVLLGVAVGALPRARPGTAGWTGLGLLAAFAAWTALSLGWTESVDRTFADLARVATYLGVFALALFARGKEWTRHLVAAIAAAIAVVAVAALLSRLHPAWFPAADQTGTFLTASRERLTYPLNYWNALGALIAIGIPLVLQMAAAARTLAVRAAAAAALPAMALACFLTFSRGGVLAALLAVAVYLALAPDRLPRVLTMLVAATGSAILILAANGREALQEGLGNAAAHQQGDEVLLIAIFVCAAAAALQVGIAWALGEKRRPQWSRVSSRAAAYATAGALVVALLVAVGADAPGRASDAWAEFKGEGGPGSGAGRLSSFAGENRYRFWDSAVEQMESEPLTGTGSGTFEFWWARNGETTDIVRDTHSLYMQTLGELGIVGFLLLLAFLGSVLAFGGRAILAGGRDRAYFAAAVAGTVAFCLTAGFDWVWQNPVLPIVLLLLGSVLLTARSVEGEAAAPLRVPLRIGFAAAALAALVAIAIPLASTTLLRQSEAEARAGDLQAALEDARSAQNAMPAAAGPRLQQALVLEEMGDAAAAAAAARGAVERESTNWRNWLVLSRLEAKQGNAAAAVRDFRKAESLNPHFSLFSR